MFCGKKLGKKGGTLWLCFYGKDKANKIIIQWRNMPRNCIIGKNMGKGTGIQGVPGLGRQVWN
jgi:hypothetical protein